MTKPAHHHRRPIELGKGTRERTQRGQKKLPTIQRYHPDGWFLRTMAAGFPPRWESQLEAIHHGATVEAVRKITARREHEAAHGIGWGCGTLTMAKTPKNKRPKMMGKR